MNLPDLLTVIMDITKELVMAEGSSLLLTDEQSDDLIFNVVVGEKGDIMKGDRVPSGVGIAGTVAATGEPLIVNDAQHDPRFYNKMDSKYNFYTSHILCVPMKVMDRKVGVLEAINAIDREGFDEWDMKLLTYLAETAAIAIANRRLYYDLTNRIEELTALYEFSQSISFSSAEEDILKNTIYSVAQSIRVEKASIILYNESTESLVVKASYGLPEAVSNNHEIDNFNSIAGFVYKNGDPLIVADISSELSFPGGKDRDYKTQSFISIPIRYKNNIMGVLSLADKKNGNPFDSYDFRVLSTVASQIAEAYQNMQFHKSILQQRRLAQEIDVASEIQAKILPKMPESIKTHRVAALNRPAKEVGGDFYDYFQFDENKYGIVVADVSGKGIPAAIFMGTARNVIRAESRVNNQPGMLLRNSNKYIYEDSEHGMFVTLVYLLIDIHNNIITFGSGGHNDQLLIKHKTKEVIRLNAKGLPLGVDSNQNFEEKVFLYEPGDMMILFTDGVLEYLGECDIDIGEKKLIDIAFQYTEAGPNALIHHFREMLNAEDFTQDFTDVIDDFTLLAIQF
ncbi:MAG TPA: SpoIIE family protein phosphatase [Spirochaetota bacterium]|nr:SpoIIE family protein phosphatase [Spirochaetota bacterium]